MTQQKSHQLTAYIKERRRKLELSRADLAERLTANGYECTESAVNHWENNRAFPPIEDSIFARALATALDVSPSDLLKASGLADLVSQEALAFVLGRFSPATLQLLKEASPQDIKKVESIIRTVLAQDE